MSEGNIDPMLDYTAQIWSSGESPLLYDPQAIESFRKWGYYTQKMKVKNSDKQFSSNVNIIGLNTQACYLVNFLLFKSKNDPGDQLAWLEQTLE